MNCNLTYFITETLMSTERKDNEGPITKGRLVKHLATSWRCPVYPGARVQAGLLGIPAKRTWLVVACCFLRVNFAPRQSAVKQTLSFYMI